MCDLIDRRQSSRSRKSTNKYLEYCEDYESDISENSANRSIHNKKPKKLFKKTKLSNKTKKSVTKQNDSTNSGAKFFPIFTTVNSSTVKDIPKRKLSVSEKSGSSDANDKDVKIKKSVKHKKRKNIIGEDSGVKCITDCCDMSNNVIILNSEKLIVSNMSTPKKLNSNNLDTKALDTNDFNNIKIRKNHPCTKELETKDVNIKKCYKSDLDVKNVSSAENNTDLCKLFPIFVMNKKYENEEINKISPLIKATDKKKQRKRKLQMSSDDSFENRGICSVETDIKCLESSNSKKAVFEGAHEINDSDIKKKSKRGRKKRVTDQNILESNFSETNIKPSNVAKINSNDSEDVSNIIKDFGLRRVTRSHTNKVKNCSKSKEISNLNVEVLEKKISNSLKVKKSKNNFKTLSQSHASYLTNKAKSKAKKSKNSKFFPLFLSSAVSNDKLASNAKTSEELSNAKKKRVNKISKLKTSLDSQSIIAGAKTKMRSERKNHNSKVKVSKNEEKDLSDNSIEELTDESDVKIVKENPVQKRFKDDKKCLIESKSLIKYPLSKSANDSLNYPLYSHCNYVTTSLKSDVMKFSVKKDFNEEIQYPVVWDKILGLTSIRNISDKPISTITSEILQFPEIECKEPFIKEVSESDLLWTDFGDNDVRNVPINKSSVKDLRDWLKYWKFKFAKTDSKQNVKKENSELLSSDSCDSDGDDFSNSVIITGVPGTGKTSLVFSLANELGFKVLEVNASTTRNGRNITHQLKEALESYHVEHVKIDYNVDKNINNTVQILSDTDESNKNSSSKSKNISNYLSDASKNKKLQNVKKTKDFMSFFKPAHTPIEKQQTSLKNIKSEYMSNESDMCVTKESVTDLNSYTISSHTIILFDDIDVVFEEDEGLWSAIRNFLKISKKPVVFTAGRNLSIVKSNLSAEIKVVHLMPTLSDFTIDNLKYQCKQNGRKENSIDLHLLATWNANDVRRSLLHAQFWTLPLLENSNSKENILSTKVSEISPTKLQYKTNFLQNSLEFTSEVLKVFILNVPSEISCNFISEHHNMGYDILHSNFFPVFNHINEKEIKKVWHAAIEPAETVLNNISNSGANMWQEACAAFELKKKILKTGSHSSSLLHISFVLDDFSFTDFLKGSFCKNMDWLSLPERMKKWSSGLPVCNENISYPLNSLILEIISFIQILKLRETHKTYYSTLSSPGNELQRLVLEHPFLSVANPSNDDIKELIETMASIFPKAQYLNKTVLNMDYISTLKIMCKYEQLRQTQSGKRSNRFLHYFDSISLYIDKSRFEV